MTQCNCQVCVAARIEINEQRTDLVRSVRLIARRPGTLLAESAAERIPEIQERIKERRGELAAHAGRPTVPAKPMPRRVYGAPKLKKTKGARKPKRYVIDTKALAEALAAPAEPLLETGRNPLPVTGHCHTCDRAVSGERRFCGRCMAKRGK